MTAILPIAITILQHGRDYLFLKRRRAPYEGLWSLVGGKIAYGEHIQQAALREVLEETSAREISGYEHRGIVSERLMDADNHLQAHFLIFVGFAEIDEFQRNNREGDLGVFSIDEIRQSKDEFLPSDWYMFKSFETERTKGAAYEAELVHDESGYRLTYYRMNNT
jgi:ADP-ribose pyrophosphatase YjhB (NUDIX family)